MLWKSKHGVLHLACILSTYPPPRPLYPQNFAKKYVNYRDT
jgi:hypothetical protein